MRGEDKGGNKQVARLQVWSRSETCLSICEAHQLVKGFVVWGEWPRARGGSGMEGLRLCFCMAVLFLRVQQQYAAKGAFADLYAG